MAPGDVAFSRATRDAMTAHLQDRDDPFTPSIALLWTFCTMGTALYASHTVHHIIASYPRAREGSGISEKTRPCKLCTAPFCLRTGRLHTYLAVTEVPLFPSLGRKPGAMTCDRAGSDCGGDSSRVSRNHTSSRSAKGPPTGTWDPLLYSARGAHFACAGVLQT